MDVLSDMKARRPPQWTAQGVSVRALEASITSPPSCAGGALVQVLDADDRGCGTPAFSALSQITFPPPAGPGEGGGEEGIL